MTTNPKFIKIGRIHRAINNQINAGSRVVLSYAPELGKLHLFIDTRHAADFECTPDDVAAVFTGIINSPNCTGGNRYKVPNVFVEYGAFR